MGCCISILNHKVSERFPDPSCILLKEVFHPNLQYRKSNGAFQVKGNGALVLTQEFLWFTPAVSCIGCCCQIDDLEIPVDEIKKVTITNGTPQLTFNSGIRCICIDVGYDAFYFVVNDISGWKSMIEKTVGLTEYSNSLSQGPPPPYTEKE